MKTLVVVVDSVYYSQQRKHNTFARVAHGTVSSTSLAPARTQVLFAVVSNTW